MIRDIIGLSLGFAGWYSVWCATPADAATPDTSPASWTYEQAAGWIIALLLIGLGCRMLFNWAFPKPQVPENYDTEGA
jgi:hypothetical protein